MKRQTSCGLWTQQDLCQLDDSLMLKKWMSASGRPSAPRPPYTYSRSPTDAAAWPHRAGNPCPPTSGKSKKTPAAAGGTLAGRSAAGSSRLARASASVVSRAAKCQPAEVCEMEVHQMRSRDRLTGQQDAGLCHELHLGAVAHPRALQHDWGRRWRWQPSTSRQPLHKNVRHGGATQNPPTGGCRRP